MKLIESLFRTIGNWCENKMTPAAEIMRQKVDRERYMQLHEAELDRMRHLQLAEHHRGLASAAENTLRRLKGEAV